jgi:VIT1/CCC1 family predicted Fe2+/Mn2+ transporter
LAGIDSLLWWAASGVLAGAFGLAAYVFVFRAAPEALPVTIASIHTLGAVKAAWSGAYPGVALSSGLRVVMLFAAAWLLLYLWKPRVTKGRSSAA